MFEYNKKYWERMFESDDEDVKPNRTWYAAGILICLLYTSDAADE